MRVDPPGVLIAGVGLDSGDEDNKQKKTHTAGGSLPLFQDAFSK